MRRMLVLVLCACLVSSGCTALRPVALVGDPPASHPDVAPGREAVIQLRGGAAREVHIVAVDDSGLTVRSGAQEAPHHIAFADIQSLQVRRVSLGRTLAAVGGAVVVAAGVLFALVKQAHAGDD